MSGDHPSDQQIAAATAAAGGWQFGEQPSVPICQVFQTGSSSCPTVESFQSSLWNPSFSEKPAVLPPRLDMGWNSPDPGAVAARLGVFSGGMLPPSLSNFAVDSSFIERAARFSNFSGGSSLGALPPNAFGMSGASEVQIQNSEGMRDASVSMDHGSRSQSPMKNHHREDVVSGEVSPGGFANVSGDSSSKGLSAKKRKKNNQEMELDPSCPQFSAESPMENSEAKQKVGNSCSTQATGKSTGKNAKGSSDPPKEDYIHVRARRGQATNSHSLAERVRRERISERMKYLQDLVPGCSKVTGKAVMLDEIINYVQSLQRQVEFLSMKLATVNPGVDFNIEGLLSKDLSLQQLLQSRGGPSTMGFSQEILHPQLLPSQQCLVETGIPGLVNQSDALRRAINAQFSTVNGFKEPPPQILNQWDAEINNVMQMSYGANPPPNTQESNVKPHDSYQM